MRKSQTQRSKQCIAEQFHVQQCAVDISLPSEDLNITPHSKQPAIRANHDDGQREVILMRWGMVPLHTKEINQLKGRNMFNARAETISGGGPAAKT